MMEASMNYSPNKLEELVVLNLGLVKVITHQSLNEEGKVDLRDSDVQKILNLLFTHCKSEEEGVWNGVAGCLGKLVFIEPEKLGSALKDRTASSFAFTRATVHVRRAAMSTLSTAAHNRPELVKDLLPTLLPLLYDQTVVKTDPSYFITPILLSRLSVMDALVNPLEKSMTNKTKPDVVKQEVDHNEDMIHSALHAIDSLDWINSELTTQFKAFMNHVQKSGSLADKYSIVHHESDTVGGGDTMDFN
ncbi:unnamed protein product [Sphagnum jensenii]|uniref:TATA-binding protein interacting (TIP20) domain-containing protein n=1 Tax=Sphagnum jensenii TaxID=128206 RepID=A0ABP1BX26_9BRYO